ncbi:MAG: hypothetical protein OXS29_14290 [bacterium]|nr:hypothetical protein [bacterium]MDE0289254.1 hypothetical protein [bacterium]MDE0438621.1 hypothetical protein [bacterium]
MKSYPDSEKILEDLGDKVLEAFSEAMSAARADLAQYRQDSPEFVVDASPRGLANWIHDRLMKRLIDAVEGMDHVSVVESGPTRELFVSGSTLLYRIRAKRHDVVGNVRTYPTQGALEFLEQTFQPTLDGLFEVHLILGYRWEADSYEIGPTVLSLRDGIENIIWLIELDRPGSTGSGATDLRPPSLPDPPRIGLPLDGTEADRGS